MIGIIADPSEHDVVREFFELFKTPWEFFREDREYDVLLCTGDYKFTANAKLVIFYAGRKLQFDDERQVQIDRQSKSACFLSYRGARVPIYGDSVTFLLGENRFLTTEDSRECVAYLDESKDRVIARIGYDLFGEIRALLRVGQPPANAMLPALELHIAFLRDLIIRGGISFVEIPPVPEGYQFVACLTHDVDHPSIYQHKWDHTIIGFLLRATFGSLVGTFLRRISIRDAARNWVAAIKLPFVYMGFAEDFWHDFDDRYLEMENGLPSTFFLIPRKNYPGKRVNGAAPRLRASNYEAKDLAGKICKLKAAGCEVGLHGIDAWLDGASGHQEFEEIRRLTGASEIGVRMHWLYFNENSPMVLEKTEASYDSTIGYNETVGYRAGTTQAYKPLDAERLLELPLHVMDTALFYLSYLALSPPKANARLSQLTENAVQYGGCLTVNWHDRSLVPERLWGGSYHYLLQELKSRGAWFATAGQAVSWFRKRRSASFETDRMEPGGVRVAMADKYADNLPNLRLRIYEAAGLRELSGHCSAAFVDKALGESFCRCDL